MRSFAHPPFDVSAVTPALRRYARTYSPDHEVSPRAPVAAVDLVSPTGVHFTLVREALEPIGDGPTGIRALAWCLWTEAGWVGYLGSNVQTNSTANDELRPFRAIPSRRSPRAFNRWSTVEAYRCWLTDGTHPEFASVMARGHGLMYTAYVQIIRELSMIGWTLSSGYTARNAQSRALWERIRGTPGIEVVRSVAQRREFGFVTPPDLLSRSH